MSGPFGSSQWMYSSGGFYDFPIEQSLKFNDDDSSYLSWTPASAGNRKTWTWSGWVKRGNLTNGVLFGQGTGTGSNGYIFLRFDADNLQISGSPDGGTFSILWTSSAVFRDPSAWYHVVAVLDTTEATGSDRFKLYVNNVLQAGTFGTTPSLNADLEANRNQAHQLGAANATALNNFLDGYLAEVNFIDGQALDATSFGEFKSGVWIPKDPSGLTYGTNGFRLSFQNDTVSEGFNTVTYTGDASSRAINGLGLAPDLVWIKNRSGAYHHGLFDSVRGANKVLKSSDTSAEGTFTQQLMSFNSDGFSLGDNSDGGNYANISGNNYVAWCWDAGSGSAASNTSGSITSTVKANTAYGFSVISYTGTGSNATVGHGLSSAPEMIIVKNRSNIGNWGIYHSALGATKFLQFTNGAEQTATDWWNDTAPTSTVFSLGTSTDVNQSSSNMIAYAFHSVTGYSKVGSYSGSGAAGNAVTTGFKPAFVMIKRTDTTSDWQILDATRDTSDARNKALFPSDSRAEISNADNGANFTATGFELNGNGANANASGGTYIYLAFADTRDNAFWRDQSGNGNDWQPNNLTYQDSLPDSTTNNFATLNPLAKNGHTLSEGNCRYTASSSTDFTCKGSYGLSSGKWYWEVFAQKVDVSPNNERCQIGITGSSSAFASFLGNGSTDYTYFSTSGSKWNNNTETSYGASYATGDIIGIALDLDAGTLVFYKNGVSQGTAFSGLSGEFSPALGVVVSPSSLIANFGQDSSFAGNKPAQGNTDDNGLGDFYYSPPSGYLALCTANLPDPVIDPAQDDVPSDYFNTVLYTGNGSTQSITGVGFQPDWVWIKRRSGVATNHILTDAVRGATQTLISNATDAEITQGNDLQSFDTDGFSVGNNVRVNQSGGSFVAWNWLAGNGTSSNTDGSITSTVSVDQKAGFSIVSYTGNGTNGATVGHGLGVAPNLWITKNRDSGTADWMIKTSDMASNEWLRFTNSALLTTLTGNTANSTVITTGGNTVDNASGQDFITYAFAEVEGYSKIGSFVGNGSTDGPFIFLGHSPSFLLIKNTSSLGEWMLFDSARSTFNPIDKELYANASDAEATVNRGDMLSNGVKIRSTSTSLNTSGNTYIYLSFASNPFKFANAR